MDRVPIGYRFFVFELSVFGLTQSGRNIRIEPKPLALLIYLVAHRDRLVLFEEMDKNIWKSDYVLPNTRQRAIKQIRRALGDTARAPQFIATVPRRGYQFIWSPVQVSAFPAGVNSEDSSLIERLRLQPIDFLWRDSSATAVGSLPARAEKCGEILVRAEELLDRPDLNGARQLLEEAIDLAQTLGAAALEARGLSDLGSCFLASDDAEAATSAFSKALRIAKRMKNGSAQMVYLNNLGVATFRQRHFDRALVYYQEALALAALAEDRIHEAFLLAHISRTHRAAGETTDAWTFGTRAMNLVRCSCDNEAIRLCLAVLAELHEDEGRYSACASLLTEIAHLMSTYGTPRQQYAAWQNLGVILLDHLNAYRAAILCFERAYQLAVNESMADWQIDALKGLGRSEAGLDRLGSAIATFHRQLSLSQRIEDRAAELSSVSALGSAFLTLGNVERALDWLAIAAKMSVALADQWTLSVTYCNAGVVLDDAGQCGKAIPYYEKALEIAIAIDDPVEQATNLVNLAIAYARLRHAATSEYAIKAATAVHLAGPHLKAIAQTKRIARMLRQQNFRAVVMDKLHRRLHLGNPESVGCRELLAAMAIL